jgi:hypothetical protein
MRLLLTSSKYALSERGSPPRIARKVSGFRRELSKPDAAQMPVTL